MIALCARGCAPRTYRALCSAMLICLFCRLQSLTTHCTHNTLSQMNLKWINWRFSIKSVLWAWWPPSFNHMKQLGVLLTPPPSPMDANLSQVSRSVSCLKKTAYRQIMARAQTGPRSGSHSIPTISGYCATLCIVLTCLNKCNPKISATPQTTTTQHLFETIKNSLKWYLFEEAYIAI